MYNKIKTYISKATHLSLGYRMVTQWYRMGADGSLVVKEAAP